MLLTWNLLFICLAGIAAAGNVTSSSDYQEPYSPYSYPSPNATGLGWEFAFAKAQRWVAQLSIEEKVGLCTGTGSPSYLGTDAESVGQCVGSVEPIERLNFTGICYMDADTGVGASHFWGTGFPNGVTVASTFNRELIRARGYGIGTEFRIRGAHVVLGPVLAHARSVVGGTNFEGFGADSFLIGVAGYETVIGHQSAGVQASSKQYLAYDGQQYDRFSYSSNMDDKTFHETLLWPYAEAVRAGTSVVMTSYPYINNTQSNENGYLLNDVLKTHLGFQGSTQTDWYGLKAGVAAILAGLDQYMPGWNELSNGTRWSYYGTNLTTAVYNGSVPESRLTDAAVRIMTPYFYLEQDRNFPRVNFENDPRKTIVNSQRQRHSALAREIAAAGTVLLKNVPGYRPGKKGLPLSKPTTITVFGQAAGPNPYGPNQRELGHSDVLPQDWTPAMDLLSDASWGVNEGTLATGGGSGSTYFPHLQDPLSAIQLRAMQDLTAVDWSLSHNLSNVELVAKRGTVCIPVVTLYSEEGVDSNTTLWHNGDALIQTVADNCDNTIVVVQAVGPANMEKWIDHENVTAVVWANMAGEELGPALVDILYGDVNPSGRLVYTIARNDSDYVQSTIVTEPQPHPQINYTEGISIDYRSFEKNGIEPRFWFGHGLSYSNFTYSDLSVTKHVGLDTALETPIEYVADAPGGDPALWEVAVIVSLNVKNDGPWDGTEIVQLYLQLPDEAENPTKILRGFESVKVRDGETQHVYLYLRRKDISYWDVINHTWTTAEGTYTVYVGASVADIRLQSTFTI